MRARNISEDHGLVLEGIEGAHAVMDDILVAGKTVEEHDAILQRVIRRATEYNLKLNMSKCRIRQSSVKYVGHQISGEGLSPDPDKLSALREMPALMDKAGVKRLVGFITYLSKFVPRLSEELKPITDLLCTEIEFQWQPAQQQAFQRLKDLCCESPTLALYDVSKPLEIHCDASSTGLGAVLVQCDRPIYFSSRRLTNTEQQYAQIEKEMLSVVHACSKFHHLIFGRPVTVYNDHKPLEIISKKPLLSAPMRLQRMLLRIQCYDLTISYRK